MTAGTRGDAGGAVAGRLVTELRAVGPLVRSRLARVTAGCAALALLMSPAVARAAPTARLVYSRAADAASCPDEAALRRAVSQRVGYDMFFPWAPRTVVVTVVRRQGDFVATVSLVDEDGIDHGAHELHTGVACADLLDTVALAVAIAIDPQSLLSTSASPSPAPVAPPEPAPPVPVPAQADGPAPKPTAPPAEPSAPTRTTRRLVFEASLGAVASDGMAPNVTVGATLGAAVRRAPFSLAIEGAVNAPASESVKAGGSASAWLTYGALVPCVSVGPVFGCVLAQAGSLQSSGEGVPNTRSSSNPWWALGGRVGGMLPVTGRLLLRLRLDLVGNLRPTNLKLDETPAWDGSSIAGSLGIDAVLRF